MQFKNETSYMVNRQVFSYKADFRFFESVEKSATMINIWHEDFPLRVEDTIKQIEMAIGYFKQLRQISNHVVLDWDFLCDIHRSLCKKLNPKNIRSGDMRDVDVRVGDSIPMKHIFLPDTICEFFPHRFSTLEKTDIIDWYLDFETIHPFEDLNGRIGGIIIASLSYLNYGKYLSPLQ